MDTQNTDIIIIGPVGAGKTTQGKLVAEALNKQSLSLDNVANDYYAASGFSPSDFQKAKEESGYLAAYRLWCPSLAYAAQRVVKDYTGCVIDFGAGHSHYEDKLLFEAVQKALAGFQHIILLLPTADLNQSVALLKQQCIDKRDRDWVHDGYDFIEHWVKDDCNHDLATDTIYTDGQSPVQTCEQILKIINT